MLGSGIEVIIVGVRIQTLDQAWVVSVNSKSEGQYQVNGEVILLVIGQGIEAGSDIRIKDLNQS